MSQDKIRFVFNGKAIIDGAIEAGTVNSLHQAAQRAGISYPTVFGWNKPQDTNSPDKISLVALAQFLVNGLGYSHAQIEDMRVSDLLTLIPLEPATPPPGETVLEA